MQYINKEYFYRMLSPEGLALSKAYHDEEESALMPFLMAGPAFENFIAVGAGELTFLRLARDFAQNYVCVEPLIDLFLNDAVKFLVEHDERIILLDKEFDNLNKEDLPEGPSFYMFFFNIICYIQDPLSHISRLAKSGDIIFLSTWAKTPEATKVRKDYFGYLNGHAKEEVIEAESQHKRFNLSEFPIESIPNYHHHERIRGKIADILIVYTGDNQ